MPIPPFLEGDRVLLRGVSRKDLSGPMAGWTDDREVTRHLSRGTWPSNPGRLEAEYETTLQSPADVELAIVAKADDRHIGITGLHQINWISRSAEFRILIGEKDHWGKGIGTETTQLMLAYAFELLNLNRVWLGVNSENTGALKTYLRAGLIKEGELRDEIYRNGRYYPVIRMAMLRCEYEQVKATWSLFPRLQTQFRA